MYKIPPKIAGFFAKTTFKFYVLFVCILLYVGIKILPFSFLPDVLNLGEIDPFNYFYLLTEITASIFGILITVVLLTFQMLKTISIRRRDQNILHNKHVVNFVSLSVFIIIGSVYSYSSIHDFSNSRNVTIAYFLLYLFILFIILIYPVARFILDEVNWLRKTEKEIDKLVVTDYRNILPLQFQRFHQKDNQNSLFRIGSQLLTSIRDNDSGAISAILHALNTKTIALIGDGKDRPLASILCRGLTLVWKWGYSEALRASNTYYFSNVWESIEEIYEFAAQKKAPLLHLQDIDMFIYEFIEFLSKNRFSDSLLQGSDTLYATFKANLKDNCPPQCKHSTGIVILATGYKQEWPGFLSYTKKYSSELFD